MVGTLKHRSERMPTVTIIKILIEQIDDWYVISSRDEYGEVAKAQHWSRDKALQICKKRTLALIDGAITYEISELPKVVTK
jgi:hypothetical protein